MDSPINNPIIETLESALGSEAPAKATDIAGLKLLLNSLQAIAQLSFSAKEQLELSRTISHAEALLARLQEAA